MPEKEKTDEQTIIKREYKDRLFKLIFGREEYKEATLDLYNAITGSNFTDTEELKINTIEDAVYCSMHNDVSFIIAETINLFEHQSSYSPNIPMRMLLYVSKLYSKMLDANPLMKKKMYTHSQVVFPTPKFYVFFNGPENEPEQTILEISKNFKDGNNSDLQLKATMYNINYGKNRELKSNCSALSDYSKAVHNMAEYKSSGMEADEAVAKAIEALPDGLVKRILIAHRAEATEMFLTEYDEELTHQGFYEDGYENGRNDVKAETAKAMLADGMPEDKVAKYTSLPIEEVLKFKEN